MASKPSRTREERKNPSLYVPESELRQQLEQQALQKRQQKTLETLKEKQEILDHYANFKLPGGEGDTELDTFLAQKRQELDILSRQLESQAPELFVEGKQGEQRDIKRKEAPAPVFYDNFFTKEENMYSDGRIVSKSELEREKRLRLREEERMRRLAGVQESAYASNNKTSLPEIKQPGRDANEDLVLPIHKRQQAAFPYEMQVKYAEKKSEPVPIMERKQASDPYERLPVLKNRESERNAVKESLFGNQEAQYLKDYMMRGEEKENTPINSMAQEIRYATENKPYGGPSEAKEGKPERENLSRASNREKGDKGGEKAVPGSGIFDRLGSQGNINEAEKKRKYKEELDALVRQKKEISSKEGRSEQERVASRGNLDSRNEMRNDLQGQRESRDLRRPIPSAEGAREKDSANSNNKDFFGFLGSEKSALEREEKKKKYAEELMQEIAMKEREREKAKLEKRGYSAVPTPKGANEGYRFEYEQRREEIGDRLPRIEDPRSGPGGAVGGGGGMPGFKREDDNSEMEKKRKYKEFLDAQVQEKKRREGSKQGVRAESYSQYQQGNVPEREERFERYDDRPQKIERAESGSNNNAGEFFMHKAEDEEKQRAQVRNIQKQKMAEELKKQMEEKEEQKRREKMKKAEEDLREKERLEREAQKEKMQQQEEVQRKRQLEKKNVELNTVGNNQENPPYDPRPQVAFPAEEDNKFRQDMEGRQQEFERFQQNQGTSPRRKEDLGEHHPYLSRQNFYGGGNRQDNRVAFDPSLFPQNQYYPGGMQGNYGYGEGKDYQGYGQAPHMQNMQRGYPAPGPGYGGAGDLYQEMMGYNQLMQQLMEEKLKIEKIALEEQLVVEQYNNKIKEMRLEKIRYEKESEKIRKILQGEMPLSSSMIGGIEANGDKLSQIDMKLNALNNSYLPTLINLKNAKASHMNHFNKLLMQSQQSFAGALHAFASHNPYQQGALGLEDTLKSQPFEDSAIFRQSLPSSSDYRYQVSKAQMENSYYKDLKAFQEGARGLNAEDNPNAYQNQLMDHNFLYPPPQAQGAYGEFAGNLPMESEIKIPETKRGNEIVAEPNFVESMIMPEGEESKTKMRKIEQTPQVLYDKTPKQMEKEPMSEFKLISDFKLDKIVPNEGLQLKAASPKESNRNTVNNQTDLLNRESIAMRESYNQEKDRVIRPLFGEGIKKDSAENENKSAPGSPMGETGTKLKNEEEMEVKLEERKSERSLILAEEDDDYNQEEFDAFTESADPVLEELGLIKRKKKKVSESPKKVPGIAEEMVRDKQAEQGRIRPGSQAFENQQGGGFVARNIGTATSSGSNAQERRHKGPKTLDPFAKVMQSDTMSKQREMLTDKKNEGKNKEVREHDDFSKWSQFIMESERKPSPEKKKSTAHELFKEKFEPIKVDESVFKERNVNQEDDDNEAYVDEDQHKEEPKGYEDEDREEIEEEVNEYEDVKEATKGRKENRDVKQNRLITETHKPQDEDVKFWSKPPKMKGSNTGSLKASTENIETTNPLRFQSINKENKGENETRSRTILDRLQKLLDDWGDTVNEEREEERRKENEEDFENSDKASQSRDLFKPFSGTRSYSNRYSHEVMNTTPSKTNKHAPSSGHLIQQIDLKSFKFKTKTPKASDSKFMNEAFCHVCFQFHKCHSSSIERKLPYPDKGADMLICYGCEMTVHRYCYGLKTPINEVKEGHGTILKMFVCEKCQEVGPASHRDCAVCSQKDGAMKKVAGTDTYVHIVCALFSDSFCIDDFEKMTIRPCSVRSDKRTAKQTKSCEFCHKQNNLVKCDTKDCETSGHVYCVLKSIVRFPPHKEDPPDNWKLMLSTQQNVPRIAFDVEDPRLHKILEELYIRLTEGPNAGHPDKEKQKDHSRNNSASKSAKKKAKKGKAHEQDQSEEIMKLEEEEKIIHETHEEMKEKLKKVLQKFTGNTSSRGGSLVVQCKAHKEKDVFCLCNLTYEEGRPMVACEACDNWFDYECLGFSKEDQEIIEEIDHYFCRKCRRWRTYVHNFFKQCNIAQEHGEEADVIFYIHPECKMVDKLEMVPQDTSKFTIHEFIIVSLMLQIKIFQEMETECIQKGEDLLPILEDLVDSARFVPINLNGLAITLATRFFSAHGIDLLVKKAMPLDKNGNIESVYVPEKNEFVKERAEKLEEVVQYLEGILKVYEEHDLLKTPQANGIKKLIDKGEWILEISKAVEHKGSKGQLSNETVSELLKKADSIGVEPKNPEREYLESLLGNSLDLGRQVKKNLNEKAAILKEKIAELEGVESQNLPLEKALKALEDIEVICKSALEAKPNITEFEEFISKNKEGGMEVENHITSVENEVNRAKELENKLKAKKRKGSDDLEKKIGEVCESLINLPEIEQLVEDYKKGKAMELKLHFYLKQGLREIKQENQASTNEDKMDAEDEEKENENEDKKGKENGKKSRSSAKKSKDNKSSKSNKGRKESVDTKADVESKEEEVIIDDGDDESEIGTLEEVEQVLKESEGLDHGFLKDKSALSAMLQDITGLKKKIKEMLEKTIDVKDLEALRKESKKFKFSFKEKEELKEKCRLYKEMSEEIRNKVCTVDELLNLKEKFSKVFKDQKLQMELKARIDRVKKLEKDAEKILNKKSFTRDDVEKKAQALIEDIQEQKIKISQIEDLEGLQKSLRWLESLYRFRKQALAGEGKGSNGHMEIEKEKDNDREVERKQSDANETDEPKGKEKKSEDMTDSQDNGSISVDTLVKGCDTKGEEWEKIYKKYYVEFKDVVRQGSLLKHRDQKIDKVYKEHLKLFCEMEAGPLFEKNKFLNIEDVDRVWETGQKLGVEATGGFYDKAAEARERYRKWIKEVEEVVSAEQLKYAFEEDCNGQEEELNKLREKAERLVKEYSEIRVDSREENKILRGVWRWLEWSWKGREMLKMVKQGQKVSLEAIEEFVSYAQEIKIPSDSWLFKASNKSLEELDSLKEEFEELKKARKNMKRKIRGIYKESEPQKRKKELEKLVREKSQLDKVKEMEKKVKDSSLFVIQSEIEEMQGDIKKCETWVEKARNFLEKYGKDLKKPKEEKWDQLVIKEGEASKILRELSGIKNEMRSLTLKDGIVEEELRRFDWFLRTTLLMEKKLERGNHAGAWVKLKRIADKDKKGEKRLGDTELYGQIVSELEKYERLFKRVEELKMKEAMLMQNWWIHQGSGNLENIKRDAISKEEFENLLKEISECKIDMKMDEKHLQELLVAGEEALEFFKGAIKREYGEKVPLDFVKNLLKRFQSTIIEYPEEEKTLIEYVKKAKEMWKVIESFGAGAEKIENVYQKYKECPVQIHDAEKLCEEYNQGVALMRKIDEMLKEEEKLDLNEIEQKAEELDNVTLEFGDRLEEAKRKLCRMKIRNLKRISQKEEIADEDFIEFIDLKEWLNEVHMLLDNEDDKEGVKEEIDWVENLVKEVEKKIEEVQNVKDINALEDMTIACGFIDITREVKKQKKILEKKEKERREAERLAEEEKKRKEAEAEKEKENEKEKEKEETEKEQKTGQAGDNMEEQEVLGKRTYSEMIELKSREEPKEDEVINIDYDPDNQEESEVLQKKVKGDEEKIVEEKKVGSEETKKLEKERRERARKGLCEAMGKNSCFDEVQNRQRNIGKRLELGVFLKEGPRVKRYEKSIQKLCMLLELLKNDVVLSKKVVEKDFELKFLEELVEKFTKPQHVQKNVNRRIENNQPKDNEIELIEESPPEKGIEHLVTEEIGGEKEPVSKENTMPIEETKGEKNQEKDEGTISVSSHQSYIEENKPQSEINFSSSNREAVMGSEKPANQDNKMEEIKVEKPKEKQAEVIGEDDDVCEVIEEGEDEGEEDEDDEDNMEEDEEDEEDEEEDYDEDEYEDEDEDEENQEVVNLESEEEKDKKQKISQIPAEKEKLVEEEVTAFENGSILMIYEGKINYTGFLNQSVSLTAGTSSGVKQCILLTSEDSKFVCKFPKLPKEISIVGKSGQKEAMEFIEKLYKDFTNNPGREKSFLVGWVEAKKESLQDLSRLADELLERKKVALVKYSEFAEMCLLHPAMLKKDMVNKLDWKIRTIEGQRKPKSALLFMIHRKHRSSTKYFEKIRPEFVGMAEKLQERKDTQDQSIVLEVEEESEPVSPLTSIAGDEFMNGQPHFMQFNMNQMMNMVPMGGHMGGHGMLNIQQFMAASMLGGQIPGMTNMNMNMGAMGYNPEIMSMLQVAQTDVMNPTAFMGGFANQGLLGMANQGTYQKGGRNNTNNRQNIVVNEVVDDEEDEEDDDEEDVEDDEDEDEYEEYDDEEIEQVQEIIDSDNEVKESKPQEKKKKTPPRNQEPVDLEEIEDDDDNVNNKKQEPQRQEIIDDDDVQEEKKDDGSNKEDNEEEDEDDDDDDEGEGEEDDNDNDEEGGEEDSIQEMEVSKEAPQQTEKMVTEQVEVEKLDEDDDDLIMEVPSVPQGETSGSQRMRFKHKYQASLSLPAEYSRKYFSMDYQVVNPQDTSNTVNLTEEITSTVNVSNEQGAQQNVMEVEDDQAQDVERGSGEEPQEQKEENELETMNTEQVEAQEQNQGEGEVTQQDDQKEKEMTE